MLPTLATPVMDVCGKDHVAHICPLPNWDGVVKQCTLKLLEAVLRHGHGGDDAQFRSICGQTSKFPSHSDGGNFIRASIGKTFSEHTKKFVTRAFAWNDTVTCASQDHDIRAGIDACIKGMRGPSDGECKWYTKISLFHPSFGADVYTQAFEKTTIMETIVPLCDTGAHVDVLVAHYGVWRTRRHFIPYGHCMVIQPNVFIKQSDFYDGQWHQCILSVGHGVECGKLERIALEATQAWTFPVISNYPGATSASNIIALSSGTRR
jgi:hypothetical protein